MTQKTLILPLAKNPIISPFTHNLIIYVLLMKNVFNSLQKKCYLIKLLTSSSAAFVLLD